MTEYILIVDGTSRIFSVETTSNQFIERFMSYQQAKDYAEEYYKGEEYEIFASCTNERNYVI